MIMMGESIRKIWVKLSWRVRGGMFSLYQNLTVIFFSRHLGILIVITPVPGHNLLLSVNIFIHV